ncbi:MAG: NAD-binding protein [Gammaproteobacteria bacterium]|nr:NAD-binding protein [Gammaproteobacteria bacterium]
MTVVTSLILRQMRMPFIILILGYSIAIIGMTLTPGVDAQGNTWYMSIFDAFYFVSFTATTIGFGEIPYPLSAAQKMWALVTIYVTVISWLYAIGKILSLFQDPTFKEALIRNTFSKNLSHIHEPFILICGFGETGQALTKTLTNKFIRTVIIEQDNNKIRTLDLQQYLVFVPGMQGDAKNPEHLLLAGLQNKLCTGVIAVTASDETNLKIAITSKLLNPDISVVCRSELKEYEDNMFSFGTNYVINPFETFANTFGMALQSPSLHLLYDWLTGVPDTNLSNPIYVTEGHWIICGFGRFGAEIFKHLRNYNIRVTVIEPRQELRDEFQSKSENRDCDFILGTGYDAHTLTLAGVENSVGIVSGTNNDSNNLSIIMTACELNPELFVVARQNKKDNERLFKATHANLIMQPSDIIARKIRTLLTTPLMLEFLEKGSKQDQEWANIAVSRISGVIGNSRPNTWTIKIEEATTRALYKVLKYGRMIRIENILQDSTPNAKTLNAVPLMIKRGNQTILMPTNEIALKLDDELLICGTEDAKLSMIWTMNNIHSINYIMTYEDMPDSYVFRKLFTFWKKNERRKKPRTQLTHQNKPDNHL